MQYTRATRTSSFYAEISRRSARNHRLDVVVIEKLFVIMFRGKEYAFAVVRGFHQFPSRQCAEVRVKLVSRTPTRNIEIIPAQCLKAKVVLMRFTDVPICNVNGAPAMLVLSRYR